MIDLVLVPHSFCRIEDSTRRGYRQGVEGQIYQAFFVPCECLHANVDKSLGAEARLPVAHRQEKTPLCLLVMAVPGDEVDFDLWWTRIMWREGRYQGIAVRRFSWGILLVIVVRIQ